MLCEGLKRLFGFYAHHLPVACHRVLAVARLCQPRKSADWLSSRLHLTAAMQIEHSKPCKIWDVESLHPLKYLSKGVYICVSKPFRVWHCTDSQRIQDYHKNSVIFLHSVIPPFSGT